LKRWAIPPSGAGSFSETHLMRRVSYPKCVETLGFRGEFEPASAETACGALPALGK
jgi:hypothetical protein